MVPAQIFRTADGWVTLFISHDDFWRRFCTEAGKAEWIADARFATMPARRENREAVIAALEPVLLAGTTASWVARLAPLGVVVAPIETLEQALASPLARERDMVISIDTDAGPLRAVGNPVRIAGQETKFSAPPLLGEHGAQLLRPNA